MKPNSLLRFVLAILFVVGSSALFFTGSPVHAQTQFVAFMEATEEDATFMIPARGYAHLTLNAAETEIDYTVVCWKTTDVPTMAHFHTGARRVNGPPVKTLNLTNGIVEVGRWTTTDGEQPLTQEFVNELKAGRLYVNVHTLNNPGGEIRGQFFMPETYGAVATTSQEVPDPGVTTGLGAGIFAVDPINNTLFYRVTASNLDGAVTAAHIHHGVVGVAGPPVKNTTVDPQLITTSGYWAPEDASQPFNAEHLEDLRAGELYWNIHTANHAPGQIRGQLTAFPGGRFFTALLSGPQEAGEVPSTAEGTAMLFLAPEMSEIQVVVTANGLSGPATLAHIHVGKANVSGPPVVTLPIVDQTINFSWTDSDPNRPFTPDDIRALYAGEFYINLHTALFPSGEIRGQIIPLSQQPGQASVEHPVKTGEISLSCSSNPVRDLTTVQYDLPYPMRAEIAMFDVTGKCVKRYVDNGSKGVNSFQMQVADLAAGAYVLKLQAGGESVAMNLMVTR